jgi:hypothetical protein
MSLVGVKIWDLLRLNYSVDQITESLATEFSVPRKQVYDDVVAFVSDLTQKRLLLSSKPNPKTGHLGTILSLALRCHWIFQRWSYKQPKAGRFLFLKALIALLVFDLLVFSKSLSRMLEFIQSWTTAPFSPTSDPVDRVCRAIAYAGVLYPKRVLCLQRSAVTTCLLRSCGVPAQMVIGAQKYPFKAHAWTEVDGRAINERRDVQNIYLVWERC